MDSMTRDIPGKLKYLRQLGLSEDNIITARTLFSEAPGLPSKKDCKKEEIILGYSLKRVKRKKALKLLGETEDTIELNKSKALASLGVAGRRRSYETSQADLSILKHSKKFILI